MDKEQLFYLGLAILAVGLLMKYVIRWKQPLFVQMSVALMLAGGGLIFISFFWQRLSLR